MESLEGFLGPAAGEWLALAGELMRDQLLAWVAITLGLGLVLLFFGLSVYVLLVGIQGAIVGAVVGGAVGQGDWIFPALGAVGGFVVAIMVYKLWVMALGALGAGVLAFLMMEGTGDPQTQFIVAMVAGVIGGFVTLWLHDLVVIVSTSALGAVLVVHAGNLIWLGQVVAEAKADLPALPDYLAGLVEAIARDGLAQAGLELGILGGLALIGMFEQFRRRRRKRAAERAATSEESPAAEEPEADPQPERA